MSKLDKKEQSLKKQQEKWKKEKKYLQEKINLQKDKKEFFQHNKNKIPTAKKLIWFLFVNCTLIELVAIIVTFKSISLAFVTGCATDFTPLVALIGAVIGEVFGYAVYSLKSAKENSVGGITYEMAMKSEVDLPPEPCIENEKTVG